MPVLDRITLQFSTSPLSISGLIRVATRSAFSHVDVVIQPGFPGIESLIPKPYGLLGSSDPGGVTIRNPNYQEFLRRHRMTLVTDKADAIVELLKKELGKPFDNDALLRVFDPNWKDWKDDGKWFCVELLVYVLLKADFWSHRPYPVHININHITPEDMLKYLAGEYDPAEFSREVKEP